MQGLGKRFYLDKFRKEIDFHKSIRINFKMCICTICVFYLREKIAENFLHSSNSFLRSICVFF